MHCLTAWGQWAMELVQGNASLPGSSEQRNPCNALPHCLHAVGSGMWCTASLPEGSGQWKSWNARPDCWAAVGTRTAAMHCLNV